jgi:hypothetical protein
MRLTIRRRTAFFVFGGIAAVAVAVALVLPQAFAGRPTSFEARIYQLTYTVGDDAPITVFASLASGAWREELGDETRISTAGSYEIVDRQTGGVYHRSGSARFMGFLQSPPPAVTALRTYLSGRAVLRGRALALRGSTPVRLEAKRGRKVELRAIRAGKVLFTVTVDRHVSDQAAAKLHLFSARPANVSDGQLPIGRPPTVPVRAYWFGRSISGRNAVAAAQHERHRGADEIAGGMNARGESEAQVTLYEDPGVTASSVQPGVSERPAGEMQVVNEPVSSAHAQGFIAALNGQNGDQAYAAWPRTTVKLADGESVDVVADRFDADDGSGIATGFTVLTATTLVHVSGSVPFNAIPDLASRLLPLR